VKVHQVILLVWFIVFALWLWSQFRARNERYDKEMKKKQQQQQ